MKRPSPGSWPSSFTARGPASRKGRTQPAGRVSATSGICSYRQEEQRLHLCGAPFCLRRGEVKSPQQLRRLVERGWVTGGVVLGQKQSCQRQVLVLAQVVQRVVGTHTGARGP